MLVCGVVCGDVCCGLMLFGFVVYYLWCLLLCWRLLGFWCNAFWMMLVIGIVTVNSVVFVTSLGMFGLITFNSLFVGWCWAYCLLLLMLLFVVIVLGLRLFVMRCRDFGGDGLRVCV